MIGQRVGNWIIEAEIGRGGMGKVYRARESPPHGNTEQNEPRYAAIKVLAPPLAHERGFVERFSREIGALRKLQHPNIVRFLESGSHDGAPYYVMEYVDGESLEQQLAERGRISWEQAVEYGIQISAALKHAHDHGVVHRDLKPQNLMLGRDGRVKLTDFGVAKVFADDRLTASNAVVGTADYLSPEQASGKPVTRRSDLYSLGVVLYAMITGRTPFEASTVADMLHKHLYGQFDPPRAYVQELPEEFDTLIVQLLEKQPNARPPDALVVGRQLERIRQKGAQKSQGTVDQVRTDSTQVLGTMAHVDVTQASNPAKVVSRIMRTEWEALNWAGPVGRLFNRAWVLLLILAGIVALAVWGFWPKSVETRLAEARQLVSEARYDAAMELIQSQRARQATPEQLAEIEELEAHIAMAQLRQRARAVGNRWAGTYQRPSCEAERLYREGVVAGHAGNIGEARTKWQLVMDAYSGVAGVEAWVVLSRDALDDTIRGVDDLENVTESVKLSRSEAPKDARRRLTALKRLYEARDDERSRIARKQIQEALDGLRE